MRKVIPILSVISIAILVCTLLTPKTLYVHTYLNNPNK